MFIMSRKIYLYIGDIGGVVELKIEWDMKRKIENVIGEK